MSDKWNLSGERVTGSVLRFDSQVALLRTAVMEVRQAVSSTPAFERATRALFTEGGAVTFPAVPKILSSLSHNRQLGALLIDGDGEILMANKNFQDLTGFTNDSAFELFFADSGGELRKAQDMPWQTALSAGQFVPQRMALSDGKRGERLRWLQFCCQPLLDGNSVEGVLTIVSEATEEIELEERMHSVIGLLSQQIEELSHPAQQLNQLMERVRTLDNFLPRQSVLTLETQVVDDSLQDDELLYRQLIEIDALEEMATEASAADQAGIADTAVSSEPAISAEAAMAIRAFEDSFNIDLNDAEKQMDALEQVNMIAQVNKIEQAITDEQVDAAEQVPAVAYLADDVATEESDGELWSEFSDFDSKLHSINDDLDEAEESIETDERGESEAAANLDVSEAPIAVEANETEVREDFNEVVSESDAEIIEPKAETAFVPLTELELAVVPEPQHEPQVAQALADEIQPLAEQIEVTQAEADKIVAEIVADDDLLEPASEREDEANHDSDDEQSLNVTIIETPAGPVRAHAAKCALIVDDIPVNQKLLVLQLKRLGFITETANNGKEAVDKLNRHIYDIVFMDCDMPVMDGYEATMAVRKLEEETGNHVPIVAMTSYDRAADKERCLACGMDDYLTKGVNASSLSRVIERTVDKARESGEGDENVETEPFDAATMAANYSKEELNEVVRLFLNAMETFVNSMQKAIDERNGAVVAHLANSIKGPSATLGLQVITKVANDILTYCESEDWPQVRLKYLKLKTVYLRSQEQLRKLCPEVFSEGAHIFG